MSKHSNNEALSWPTLEGLALSEIEKLLDAGRVVVEMQHRHGNRFWDLRRNGATKTWKTRPTEFRIPVKAGLKSCGTIENDANLAMFRVRPVKG